MPSIPLAVIPRFSKILLTLALFAGTSHRAVAQTVPNPVVPLYQAAVSYNDLAEFAEVSNENWAAIQDETGRVFVANGRGVLVYDGMEWKMVETPNVTAVRSLAVGPGNRVYVGAQGEFGYLEPDSTSFRFVSISGLVDPADAGFGSVWTTRADESKVYFQAANHLFVWDGYSVTTTHSGDSYHTSFITDQGLILRERGVGLVRYDAGETVLIPGGDFFAQKRVFLFEPRGQGYFVGTRDNGFFTLEDGTITPFPTGADELLSEYWLYTGVQTPGGGYLLGTLGAGLIELDPEGRMTARVTQDTGLPDQHITSLTPIRPAGYLATTQNNGVFFFESPAVLSKRADLHQNMVGQLYIDSDSLFIAAGSGLYSARLDQQGTQTSILHDKTAYAVVSVGRTVYVGTDEGVRVWRDGEFLGTTLEDQQVMTLARYRNGVVAGFRTGLAVVNGLTAGDYYEEDDVRSLVTVGDDIWFATTSNGIFRVREGAEGWLTSQFTEDDGLPANDRLEIVPVDGSIRVYSDDSEGVFTMAAGWFERDEDLTPHRETGANEVWDLSEGPDGKIWIGYPDRIEQAHPQPDGSYIFRTPEALRFPRVRGEAIYVADDGALWFNRAAGVVRYDPAADLGHPIEFDVILREVRSQKDEKLISGVTTAGVGAVGASAKPGGLGRELGFDQNSLVFGYAVANPAAQSGIEYSWRVDPGSRGWSAWSKETEAAPGDLPEGAYSFSVRARDQHHNLSNPLEYRFEVLPPWQRTWWAFLIYAFLGLTLVYYAYQYRVLTLAQKKAAAQEKELAREKLYRRKLESANTRLKQANRIKDEFLATTSHELRTPLTAILGFTNILKDEVPMDASYREFLDIIQESGDRLMLTLDDLLELAKLRAGTRLLTPEATDISALVEGAMAPIRTTAARTSLFVRLRCGRGLNAFVDPTALSKILWSLLDNAVKFTEQGGVKLSVAVQDGVMEIRVEDSGIGIEEQFIPYLFHEFRQESNGEARSHNGTGLGLAITGGLVELMGGTIEVVSEKLQGTTFTVRLPVSVGGAELDGDRDRGRDRVPARDRRQDGAGAQAQDRPAVPGDGQRLPGSTKPLGDRESEG